VYYEEIVSSNALQYVDVEKYFERTADERETVSEQFNFDVFKTLEHLFGRTELDELNKLNNEYRKRVEKMSQASLSKEFERLTIELSWKSSRIEGNTYSLIDTEILIKDKKEARGHKKEEAIMIWDHKTAFDYILDKRNNFKEISISKIENIQKLLVEDLGVGFGIRKRPVGIIGTRYLPLDNEYQIREAMESMVKLVNETRDPFSKAVLSAALISYIQPFEDGNKRTARIVADAILLAYNICPLSYRSIDESEYKKSVILFYEQNNIRFFKELFIGQFKFAVKNYFLG
jgi:Fic family protein